MHHYVTVRVSSVQPTKQRFLFLEDGITLGESGSADIHNGGQLVTNHT